MEIRVEIPNYLRRIVLSKSQQVKYYLSPKYPKAKKYLKNDFGYIWYNTTKNKKAKPKRVWGHVPTNTPVIKNPKAAGTNKTYLINGQDLYNQNIVMHTRNKVKIMISKFFEEHLKDIPVITKFPININVELHDFIRDPDCKLQLWDMDNRFFGWYAKVMQDTLKNLGKIPDDNILYITQPASPKFIPLYPDEERKMVIVITPETDERILNHPAYLNREDHGKFIEF